LSSWSIEKPQLNWDVSVPTVTSLTASPDGWLWGLTDDDQILSWNSVDGQARLPWRNTLLPGVSNNLAPPTALAAGRQFVLSGFRDGTVRAHHAARLIEVKVMTEQLSQRVTAAAINESETWGAVGSEIGELRLVRLPLAESGDLVRGHHDQVSALAFSGAHLLASGGRDSRLRLWRADDGKLLEVLTLRLPRPVRSLAFHPDGARLGILCDDDRAVRIWDLSQFRARLQELGQAAELDSCLQKKPLAPAPPPPTSPSEPIPLPPSRGLRGDYFADPDCRLFVRTRLDPAIDFSWGDRSPVEGVPSDNFSVRWTGWLKAPAPGTYRLRVDVDDTARLWLDGCLVLDDVHFQPEVELTTTPLSLRLEMSDQTGGAHVRLYWLAPGMPDDQRIAPDYFFTDAALAERTPVPALTAVTK
jgi:hypothetical protein